MDDGALDYSCILATKKVIGLLRMEAYWLDYCAGMHCILNGSQGDWHFLLYYSLMGGLTLLIALHCIASYTKGRRGLTSCTAYR